MSPIGHFHVAFGIAALVFGAVNVSRDKGGPAHRLIGHAYYVSMLGLNGTAFLIYEVFGTFGAFHWLAVLSLVTLFSAIVPVVLHRPRATWQLCHAYFMSYSYLGLVAATAAEIAVRVPPLWTSDRPNLYFAISAAAPTVLVTLLGSILIRRAIVRMRLTPSGRPG